MYYLKNWAYEEKGLLVSSFKKFNYFIMDYKITVQIENYSMESIKKDEI